jgi:hypothetical protein
MADSGPQSPGADKKQNASWIAKTALGVSILAAVVSIVSAAVTIYRTSPIGPVKTVMPLSAYAIVRGIDPEPWGAPAPSDHIVLPAELSNNSGSTVLLKEPILELHEIGTPENKNVTFFLNGEFEELSPRVFSNVNSHPPSFATSLVLAHDSISKRVLMFRVSDWNETNYCFRFHQGQVFEATLTYQRIPPELRSRLKGEIPRVPVPLEPNLPMIEGTSDIKLYSGEYISLLRGSRAVNPNGTPRDIKEEPNWRKKIGETLPAPSSWPEKATSCRL